MISFSSVLIVLSKVWHHPANSQNKLKAVYRAVVMQIRLRISQQAVIYHWVKPIRLALRRGYHSLTAQVYFQYFDLQ